MTFRMGLIAHASSAVLVATVALFSAPFVLAQSTSDGQVSPIVEERDFGVWLQDLRLDARRQGISEATLDAALTGIEPIQRVVELDHKQPEFTQTFWGYMDKRVNDGRVKRGRDLLKQHAALFNRIEKEYGVQGRFLVSFWGLESNFGDFTGGFSVITALATLAFDPRRDDFFRNELLTALKIIDAGHISVDRMKGSWAGAMGQCQFLPSTFARFGKDGDGDGRIDIWNSLPDIFASAANFLSKSGWRGDEAWGREVRLPKPFDYSQATLDISHPIADWQKIGIRRIDGSDLPVADITGSIIVPAGHHGPAFLVYDNFRTTMVWNRSLLYAVAVGHLADRIAWQPELKTPRDASDKPMSRDDIIALQQLLTERGYDTGPADGIPGRQTREAVRAFQQKIGLPADGFPAPDVLEAIRNGKAQTQDRTGRLLPAAVDGQRDRG